MIKRRPSKQELKLVLSYKLALAVTKDYERIIIGSEDSIKQRLSGQQDADVFYDQTRPFGTFLFTSDPNPKDNWCTAIACLIEAQRILHSINPIDHHLKEGVLYQEGKAQDILTEKFDSDDPVCQFVALRIWYGYWVFREKRPAEHCTVFLDSMFNLVRPFSHPFYCIEDRNIVSASNSIFRHPPEFKSADKEQHVLQLTGTDNIEYIIVDRSLIPLEKYYISQFNKWKKYLICCKVCGRYFFADSLKFELCSQDCRDQARENTLTQRKHNEEIASVDRICLNASAHWYNRLKRMKESPEWSSDDIQKYENEKNRFLKEKSKKRKAYKKGKITFGELQDWLLHQEVEAQDALESLMVTKR